MEQSELKRRQHAGRAVTGGGVAGKKCRGGSRNLKLTNFVSGERGAGSMEPEVGSRAALA